MMGAGKTTVGRLVALDRLWGYFDSDAEVEADSGMTVPELFAAQGEVAFRDAESRALARACASAHSCVVSVAGGAVLRAENRALIVASGSVIWLRAQVATLVGRVGDGAGRPLLDGDPLTTLTALEAIRRPLYAEVADLTIDVDDRAPSAVASEILEAVAL
jgi:shikimate kinase